MRARVKLHVACRAVHSQHLEDAVLRSVTQERRRFRPRRRISYTGTRVMPAEVTLPVTGMTCGGCENAVKRAVGALAGVCAVTASHQSDEVSVTYDPDQVSRDQIITKIAALGYHVQPST